MGDFEVLRDLSSFRPFEEFSIEVFDSHYKELTKWTLFIAIKEILFFLESKIYLSLSRNLSPQKVRYLKKLKLTLSNRL